MGSYLTVIFHSRSTETSLNGLTLLTDVTIIRLEFATLMVGFTTVLLGVSNLMPSCRSSEFYWGFGSKLFGDERDELLVESQELLQRGGIELDRSQEFKK
ncbi:hypothetical protein F2Q69_00058515 [Brassica cretica]|uniref:Uncharacterized protein n=1 Tax=Brassica cretica TaxID=69181 RepID=A0A8S9RAD7_BRACR|nr:hypothetical protein F2Q69_00058515 [Brassica cretica]